jgi:hypothetical protein
LPAAIIYLVCLTGALSVFEQDFSVGSNPACPVMPSDAAVARAVGAVAAQAGDDPLYVSLPRPPCPGCA